MIGGTKLVDLGSGTRKGSEFERFGEVRIFDATNGFGLDFFEKTEAEG